MRDNFPNTRDQMLAAEQRRQLMSDALVEDDGKTADFILLAIVFFVVVIGAAVLIRNLIGAADIGLSVIAPAMICGFAAVAVFARWITVRRQRKARKERAEGEAVKAAEHERQIKAMKRERFEKGLD